MILKVYSFLTIFILWKQSLSNKPFRADKNEWVFCYFYKQDTKIETLDTIQTLSSQKHNTTLVSWEAKKNKNKQTSDKMLLQKLSEHLEPIVIFARVLLKSLFEPLFISQLHKCSSCFAWKGHTLTRPNRSQELGPADIILTWVGQINWKFNTLTVSLFQFPKDKLFLLKIFLVHNQLEKNWSAKNVLSMDGNGNNPIYSLLSTWTFFYVWCLHTVFPHTIAAATILFWNFQTLKIVSSLIFPIM